MLDSQFQIYGGNSELVVFTVTDEWGNRIDLTNASAYLIVKLSYEQTECVLEKKWDIGNGNNNVAQGVMAFELEPCDTRIDPGKYQFELQVHLDGDVKSCLGYLDVIGMLRRPN